MRTSLLIVPLAAILLAGCYKEQPIPGTGLIDTPDWTDETHGIRDEPDYLSVFPKYLVKRLDIRIDPADWALFWQDMTAIFGPFGEGREFNENHDIPRYIPCSVFFEGKQWYKVGIRAKGSMPLWIVWSEGRMKFPFKLDFDEFEDRYPAIKNQRFFGFKQLSLKNGFREPTMVREKVVNELFRQAGLPVVRSAYYELYLDYGKGVRYCGLYTLVEAVDDTVLHNYFTDITGILYKPEGPGARFNNKEFRLEDFAVHSKTGPGDFSDIRNLFNILHDPARLSDPAAWVDGLNRVFDTPGFLKWLACSTVVQNWDVYGILPHNYYLYHDPVSGRLVWIPWDHDNSFKTRPPDFPPPDFEFKEIHDDWPLIRFLIDNTAYYEAYRNEMSVFIEGPFQADRFIPFLVKHLDIVAPFVLREQFPFTCLDNREQFFNERVFIIDLAGKRYQEAIDFLKQRPIAGD